MNISQAEISRDVKISCRKREMSPRGKCQVGVWRERCDERKYVCTSQAGPADTAIFSLLDENVRSGEER